MGHGWRRNSLADLKSKLLNVYVYRYKSLGFIIKKVHVCSHKAPSSDKNEMIMIIK